MDPNTNTEASSQQLTLPPRLRFTVCFALRSAYVVCYVEASPTGMWLTAAEAHGPHSTPQEWFTSKMVEFLLRWKEYDRLTLVDALTPPIIFPPKPKRAWTLRISLPTTIPLHDQCLARLRGFLSTSAHHLGHRNSELARRLLLAVCPPAEDPLPESSCRFQPYDKSLCQTACPSQETPLQRRSTRQSSRARGGQCELKSS